MATALTGTSPAPVDAAEFEALGHLKNSLTYMIVSDLGRNGYYDQKPVAEMMGQVAALTDPEFIAALGDVHHFMGVRSIHDPLWMTNFETIYSHPELMIPWYPVLGNHESKGNTRAVIDYSTVSMRWQMPGRYYAKTFRIDHDASLLLVFIDTTPLIDKYRDDPDYGDTGEQSITRQLAFIDETLSAAPSAWKIVMGHHPVHGGTTKALSERLDLQQRLQPLLDRHAVDLYVGGHIHNFQHLRVPDSDVDYLVNASAAEFRPMVPEDGQVFAGAASGFSLCTVTAEDLTVRLIDRNGRIVHRITRKK
ncbi:metallophosphoesterase [Desulfatiferula olefinivorans]